VAEQILNETTSGMRWSTIDNHPLIPDLPFGGVGNSGWASTTASGISRFTNTRGSNHQHEDGSRVRYPPYSRNKLLSEIGSSVVIPFLQQIGLIRAESHKQRPGVFHADLSFGNVGSLDGLVAREEAPPCHRWRGLVRSRQVLSIFAISPFYGQVAVPVRPGVVPSLTQPGVR